MATFLVDYTESIMGIKVIAKTSIPKGEDLILHACDVVSLF